MKTAPKTRVFHAIGVGIVAAVCVIAAGMFAFQHIYQMGWDDHRCAVESAERARDALWECHGDPDDCAQGPPTENPTLTRPKRSRQPTPRTFSQRQDFFKI